MGWVWQALTGDLKETPVALPWLFLGRRVRTTALGMSISMFVLALTVYLDIGANGLNTVTGDALGVLAFFIGMLLWIGFWVRSDSMMIHGLLWSASLWGGVGVTLILATGPLNPSAWVSFVLTVIGGGAWLQEFGWRRWGRRARP